MSAGKIVGFTVRGMAIAVLAAGSGCLKTIESLDGGELGTPLMRRAAAKEREGDLNTAMTLYRKVLDESPTTARAHLGLAFLLDSEKKDYLRAIYHYQRYLEMRPETEKQEMIEGRIRMAKMSFAATAFRQPPDVKEELEHLKAQNMALKNDVRILQRQLEEAHAAARQPAGDVATARTGTGGQTRTYKVKAGDTLSRIAQEMYGDRRQWKRIYEANKAKLTSSDGIRVGQVLEIPM